MGQTKNDFMRLIQIPNTNEAIEYFFYKIKEEEKQKNKKNEFKRLKKKN